MNRRGFLKGMSGILAAGVAPAVVGSGILMPVRAVVAPEWAFAESTDEVLRYKVTERFAGGWTDRRAFREALRPGLESMYETEYRHVAYGYSIVVDGERMRVERIG